MTLRRTLRGAAAGLLTRPAPTDDLPVTDFTTYYDTASAQALFAALQQQQPDEIWTSYFRTHAGRFAYICELIGRLPTQGPALDVGGLPQTRQMFVDNTPLEAVDLSPDVDLEIDHWADLIGSKRYPLVIFSEVIEHFNADPARALHEINRCLEPDGHLIVTTVNVGSELGLYNLSRGHAPYAMANLYGARTDRHQREYAPTELALLVAAHGFETWTSTVNLYASAPVKLEAHAWCAERQLDPRMHGDTIVVVARKVEEPTGPHWLHPIYHGSVATNSPNSVPGEVTQRMHDGLPSQLAGLLQQ